VGERGNIIVQDGEDRVYLYTHWGGAEIGQVLQRALAKRWRWDDAQYLARIIFDELTEGERGETGFGITVRLLDNEYPLLVVDCDSQTVIVESPAITRLKPPYKEVARWSFEEFLKLADPDEETGRIAAKIHAESE